MCNEDVSVTSPGLQRLSTVGKGQTQGQGVPRCCICVVDDVQPGTALGLPHQQRAGSCPPNHRQGACGLAYLVLDIWSEHGRKKGKFWPR